MIFSIPLTVIKTPGGFIGMSAVLGLGAALLAPAATGILSESLPDGKFKNGAFAALGAGQPLGFINGLIIGGIFASQQYAIYAIAAGAAGIFAMIAFVSLPRDGEQLQINGRIIASQDNTSRPAASLLSFDWAGAALSTAGIVLLTLGLAFAGNQNGGWKSVPVLICLPVSIIMIAIFFIWESHKQRQSSSYEEGQAQQSLKAPLIPPSVWRAPRFLATLGVVFFAWVSFNALSYFCTLMYQEIQRTSPIQTSIRFLPMVGSGLALNVAGGILVARINAVWLFLAGCIGGAASAALYATLNPNWPYFEALFWVMTLTVAPDVFFPAAQLFACQTVGPRRAALAGSLFSVTVRLATSIGLALTSSIATTVTNHYSTSMSKSDALLQGYRAAGWFCFSSSCLAAILALVYLRDAGVVGKREQISETNGDSQSHISMNDLAVPELDHSSQVHKRDQNGDTDKRA